MRNDAEFMRVYNIVIMNMKFEWAITTPLTVHGITKLDYTWKLKDKNEADIHNIKQGQRLILERDKGVLLFHISSIHHQLLSADTS